MRKGFSALLCILAAGLLVLAVWLSLMADAKMRRQREDAAAEAEAALALDTQEEPACEPVEYQVSEEFLGMYFSAWIGELLPGEDETGWKLDAALRSCISSGFVHTAQRGKGEVQAVYAHEVEFALQRLFRQKVPHQSLPLAEYNAESGEYYLSPYLAFVYPMEAEVYAVEQTGLNTYAVSAYLGRSQGVNAYGIEGGYIPFVQHQAGKGLTAAQAEVELTGSGLALLGLEVDPADMGEDSVQQLLFANALWRFSLQQEDETTLEEQAAQLLYRLTAGIPPESFTNIATQAGESWFLAGLLGNADARFYNRSAAYWAARCGDMFDFAAYGDDAYAPLVAEEDLYALASALYSMGAPDYSGLNAQTEIPYGFDENTAFYTRRGPEAGPGYGEIHVWQVISAGERTYTVTATHYTLYYAGDGSAVGVGGPGAEAEADIVWQESYWDQAWIADVLRANPAQFVTVEYTLRQTEEGMWLPVAAQRQ